MIKLQKEIKPQEEFDVAIVGAGPAGGQCAKELSQKGWKVCLLEKSQKIGEPKFSTAGVPDYLLKEFDLPKTIVGDYWDKLEIKTALHQVLWEFKEIRGYVLKFAELKKFLVKSAEKNSCQVLSGAKVTDPLTSNGRITGVKLENNKEIKAKIVVDASGPAGIIAAKVDLRPVVLCSPSVGLEHMITDIDYPKNTLSFFLGSKFIPHDYGWIFPMGKNTAKIGAAVYDKTKYLPSVSLKTLLNQFIKQISFIKGGKIVESHGGFIYINGGIKNHVFKNIVAIGDCASQVNPLGGEGIRHSLRAGRMAAKAIDQSLRTGKINDLLKYQKDWQEYIGKKWKILYLLEQMIYHHSSDELKDKLLSVAKGLSPNDIFEMLFEYNFKIGLKLVKKAFTPEFLRMLGLKSSLDLLKVGLNSM